MKIRNKLTYKFAFIVASILLIFSLAIYYFSATFREVEFDKRLMNKGLTTARLFVKVDEVDAKLLRIIDRNNLTALQEEKITIYDDRYNKLYSSDDDPEIPISNEQFKELKKNKEIFFNNDKNEVVGISYNDKNDNYYVVVSAYDKFGINKLANLQLVLVIGFITSIGVVFLAGWIFSGQALKPISQIIQQVKTITVQNLDSRLNEGNTEDEIAQLSVQFNRMLEGLEQAFIAQKSFVSNASHELRTPLSTVRAQLEVTLSDERKNPEYQAALESVLEDINHLIKLSNGLLDLAQVGSDISKTNLKKIRVDELLYQCVAEVSKKFTSQQITINIEEHLEEEQLFILLANENLLKTAFINLLDNACKYSNNKKVVIQIRFSEKNTLISIIDLGVGVKTGEMQHIFDPFYRGSNVRNISGHGIGLALAQKIIQLHNGKLNISSKLNEGTTLLVQLPTL